MAFLKSMCLGFLLFILNQAMAGTIAVFTLRGNESQDQVTVVMLQNIQWVFVAAVFASMLPSFRMWKWEMSAVLARMLYVWGPASAGYGMTVFTGRLVFFLLGLWISWAALAYQYMVTRGR